MSAAKNGFTAIVQALATAPSIDLNAQDTDQKSALMWATAGQHLPVMQVLLSHKGIDAGLTDKQGHTALIMATKDNHQEVVAALLESPLVRAAIDVQDNTGSTALHFAMRHEDRQLAMKLIAAKADTSIRNKDFLSPIVVAAQRGKFLEIFGELLRAGTGPRQRDYQKIAQATGKSMLTHYREMIAADASLGPSALTVAARNGNIDVVKQLLHARADTVRLSSGRTVLEQAVNGNDAIVVASLVAAKAQVSPWGEEGESLLRMAAEAEKSGHPQLLKHIIIGAQHEAVALASEQYLTTLAEVCFLQFSSMYIVTESITTTCCPKREHSEQIVYLIHSVLV